MSNIDDTDNRYRAWGSIGKDYRTTDADGVRWVMVLEPGVGTCLVRWIGPERCPVHRLPGCECNAMTTTPGGAA